MRRAFFALILMAAACAPQEDAASLTSGGAPADGKSLEALRAESLAKVDRKACEAKGGTVRQEGMMGLWRCTLPFKDAGKTCRDGDDCEGRCVTQEAPVAAPGGALVGVCEADDSPFGCYGLIENGASEGFICVD